MKSKHDGWTPEEQIEIQEPDSCPTNAERDRILEDYDRLKAQLKTCEQHAAAMARGSDRLLEAVKLAYRKHHLEDENIGWNELSDKLCDAICSTIGDAGYRRWMEQVTRSTNWGKGL